MMFGFDTVIVQERASAVPTGHFSNHFMGDLKSLVELGA